MQEERVSKVKSKNLVLSQYEVCIEFNSRYMLQKSEHNGKCLKINSNTNESIEECCIRM